MVYVPLAACDVNRQRLFAKKNLNTVDGVILLPLNTVDDVIPLPLEVDDVILPLNTVDGVIPLPSEDRFEVHDSLDDCTPLDAV